MRKLIMSLFVLAGVCLGGALPASATAATGLAVKPAVSSQTAVDQVGYRHHGRHGGLFIGFGYPQYYGGYGYSRSRYYNNYGYNNYDYGYRPYRRHYQRHHYRRHHYRHYGW